MARVLVTGAGGFVGANLVRALVQKGEEVHAGVHSLGESWRLKGVEGKLQKHVLDITSKENVAQVVSDVHPEYVYHLVHYGGNRGQIDEGEIRRVIIDGTQNLYEACLKAGNVKAIMNSGSSSEYGPQKDPMREDMIPEPNTLYGSAKLEATRIGEKMLHEHGLPVTTLRLFSLYGPYEAKTRFFPAVILALLRGEKPALSNPRIVRDFIHVDDVVDALQVATKKTPGIYNVGTGKETTLKAATEMIQAALGTQIELDWGGDAGREFDSEHWSADITKTKRELEWEPRIPVEEGIQKTVSWFKENKKLYD